MDTLKHQSGFLESRTGDVVTLTLDRPEQRNALSVALVTGLAERLSALQDEDVRAVVLAGGPPVFCAGGDLVDLGGVVAQGAITVTDTVYRRFQGLASTLGAVPYPVVAAVDGAALGAGFDLALACDFRIVTPRATFSSSWITLGLVPGMGAAYLLTQAVGSLRAHELVLTGRVIRADEALQWGLVTRIVEQEALPAAVDELTGRLVALPAAALARSKQALRRAAQDGFAEELATLGAVQGALLTGPDFAERSARFSKR
jgi:2-(1,2-epoxy-1,2-dihydrophenyl)acetyl-CoA isomerase